MPKNFANRFENLAFDFFALGCSLDNQTGIRHRRVIAHWLNARQYVVGCILAHFFFRHQPDKRL